MMKKEYKNVFGIFIVFLFMKSEYVDCSNVLAVIPYNTRSHFIVIEPLLKELAIRGHNVTVVSPFPQKEPLKNYTDIDARHLIPPHSNTFTLDFVRKELGSPVKVCKVIWEMGSDVCEKFYADETFRNLINSSESTNGVKFDLLITEIFGTECFLGLAHILDIPVVSIVTSVALPWTGDRVGNPDNPSYIANYLTNYGDRMTLYQRVVNTISSQLAKYFSHYFSDIPSHAIAKKYLGDDLPPLEEIARKRTALVMANSYFTVNQPRPFVPNFIEIGGIHLQKPRPLEKKVKDILDNAKDGFIYFSLGSLFKGASMDPHVIESFLKAFSELPQLVLWKFEEELKDTPPNVLISKWWPQKEVLVHKNIKAFITHGGLSSTLEAVNAGVPVIGIPMFADQPGNVNNIVRRGAGIQLNYEEINYNSLKDALHRLISDKSYMKNAKEMSARFKDRPLCPLDNAAFWIEYVLRHKGGFHMHSAGTDLPLYQYLLLDVTAFISIASFSLIFIVYKIISRLYHLIVKTNKSDMKQKMKKTQ